MEIPFLGGAYEGRSSSINAQQSINMFPVFDQQEGKTVIGMYGTPGTDEFSDTGTYAIVRRMHVMGDYLYAVVGNTVYEVDSDGVATSLGTITTSTGHIGMAHNGTQLLIVDGTISGYIVTVGALASIDDGITWTARTSAADNNWTSVAYGNGVYAAVSNTGSGNRVMTSPNGTTWTSRASVGYLRTTMKVGGTGTDLTIDVNSITGISSGDSIGIELDDSSTHWTIVNGAPSGDTVTLTVALPSAAAISNSIYIENDWTSITYGNSLFVAVANTGTIDRVMTSPDGITWTIRTASSTNTWTNVTYGDGLFVAVSNSGTDNRVMTSTDGITWTARVNAVNNDWISVTYGNSLFVAVSDSGTGTRIMTSPDGIIWTIRTSAVDNDWTSITYGYGLYVAVSDTGTNNRVMTSPDGIIWTIRVSPVDNDWQAVTYSGVYFIAISNTGTGNRSMYSEDGITWTIGTSAVNNNWTSVVFESGLVYVAVGNSGTGNRVMTSPEGDFGFPKATDCVFFDGYFIISISGTGKIQISALYNGLSWDPLDYATAEASPDALVGVGTTGQNIWLFGDNTTEVYYNAGNADFPFQRVPGAVLDIGLESLTSVAEIEGVLYWLSNKKTIVRNNGYSFETVSKSSIEYQISTYTTTNDALGFTFTLEGRTFYVINFPSEDKTWVLDVKNGQWHEWESLI